MPDPLREVVRLTLEQRHGRREVARLLDLDVEEVRIRIRKGLEILSREVDLEALRKRLE